MARVDNYTRFVGWLKILLPLLALALLSTLFLVARTIDPAQNLPFADVDIDELARDQRIGAPRYSGMTSDRTTISLSARSAQPDPSDPGVMVARGIVANLRLPDGQTVDVAAQSMNLDSALGLAVFSEGVNFQTSDGLALETSSVELWLDQTRVVSNTPSKVVFDIGTLSADTFELTGSQDAASKYRLVFKGNVKLIYGQRD